MNQPYARVNQPYATLTLASALREMFGVQLSQEKSDFQAQYWPNVGPVQAARLGIG